MELPRYAETVVVGGGTSGAVVAGLLAEHGDGSVLVLEAGPDYGPVASGRWPDDLLNAAALGYSGDWGYTSEETYADRVLGFERARVIGGCSAHNGCAAIWGSRIDYDGWAAAGLAGWSTDDLLPLFGEANRRMRVRFYDAEEVTPFQAAWLEAAADSGVPLVSDLNDLDADVGMAASPVNIVGGVRWNSAFAYLDPVRGHSGLTVLGDTPVSHLVLDGNRARGVACLTSNGIETVGVGRVVVSTGAYESPAVLMRSGIGDPDDLRAVGIEPRHALPGVGKNLHDHPSARLAYRGSPEMERRMEAFAGQRWMPEEQTIAKLRSRLYPQTETGFDLHLYPVGGPIVDGGGWRWHVPVACMTPRSRGSVSLRSAEPGDRPRIDHRYRSDPDGYDTAVLAAGLGMARAIASRPPLKDLLGDEIEPGADILDHGALASWINQTGEHYYHPVGTCKMGVPDDPLAVCDPRGKVHGLDNVYVADCSVMPVIPRANTNIPAVVVGERIGRWLLDSNP
jgi:choline dehydrogenase